MHIEAEHTMSRYVLDVMAKHPFGVECLERSIAIVIFGSRASGLEREGSDLDILCIGDKLCRLKTRELDINVVPTESASDPRWLGTELATHISAYGRFVKGSPEWLSEARVSQAAIDSKQRRLAAFMRTLPKLWHGLLDDFRFKYAVKLRREAQRLLLLEQMIPIPPTRIIDRWWANEADAPLHVERVLRNHGKYNSLWLIEEFMPRILATLNASSESDPSYSPTFRLATSSRTRYWSKAL